MPRAGVDPPGKPFLPSLYNNGEVLPRSSSGSGLRHVTHLCRAGRQLRREGPGQVHVGKSPAALGNKIYSHLPHIHKRPLGVSANHDSCHAIPLRNDGEGKARFRDWPIVTIIPTPTLHEGDISGSGHGPRFRKPSPAPPPLDVRELADGGEPEF
ncbi:unnamed protein product [Tuber melanosporum]|uniref:(Perigord truffle) hypothetical protein n=1 Tax=Tuber melanosporum (strain Mel28) TaxID=656061 RepID=D5GGR5_TUBMM|nr:uncharacterized protein GSTUM_00007483001 [Tuber melanosporum]CAZ83687.1 unnamed protein product [Tuber melanosporum]